MEARAKASRLAKESERRERRIGKLERVFDAFDLDGSGDIEKEELFELGNARRSMGQARSTWTEEKNNRLVERLDQDGNGVVSKEEFATEFEKMLTYNEEDFNECSMRADWESIFNQRIYISFTCYIFLWMTYTKKRCYCR